MPDNSPFGVQTFPLTPPSQFPLQPLNTPPGPLPAPLPNPFSSGVPLPAVGGSGQTGAAPIGLPGAPPTVPPAGQVPSPFAAAPIPDVEPPKTPDEKAARKGLWAKFLQKLDTDENFKLQLRVIGLALASTPDPSQNALGHVAKALQAGFQFQLSQQASVRQQEKEERAFALKEREVVSGEKQVTAKIEADKDQRGFNEKKLALQQTVADAQLALIGRESEVLEKGGDVGVKGNFTKNLAGHLRTRAAELGQEMTESESFLRAVNLLEGNTKEAVTAKIIARISALDATLFASDSEFADEMRNIIDTLTGIIDPEGAGLDTLTGRTFTTEDGVELSVIAVQGDVATIKVTATGELRQVSAATLRSAISGKPAPNTGPTQ